MPRAVIEDNSRVSLRIRAQDKVLLMRPVALENTDITDFVIRNTIQAARRVIEQAERLTLSERDSLRVMALLENPPQPNAKLLSAAEALPDRS